MPFLDLRGAGTLILRKLLSESLEGLSWVDCEVRQDAKHSNSTMRAEICSIHACLKQLIRISFILMFVLTVIVRLHDISKSSDWGG